MFKERQGFLSQVNLTFREYVTNRRRALLIAPIDEYLLTVTGTFATSGDHDLIAAPAANKRLILSAVIVQNETTNAQTLLLKRGSTTFWRYLAQTQGSGLTLFLPPGRELRLGLAEKLVLNNSAAFQVGYSVAYFEEAIT